MQTNTAEKRIHDAYLQCKNTFDPGDALINDAVTIKNEEENLFYRLVSDFFIQQKQKEIINK
ncbi:MAG: hypothetical protein LUI39_05275 [Lachnospiraceae bacterium]|nr:hypothetical protein [Lachnospiraceae bacterium]MCD7763286.1 hypothetical protein [Lachnospiraceae bacterium]MCD7767069.1 hypothetical protein [Lachnospiraceae bacterium]